MNATRLARTAVTIAAPVAEVWEALTTPAAIKEYMFGTTVTSDWVVGSPIMWTSEWQGFTYIDKGIILQLVPERLFEYSHFSARGAPDLPEHYHVVTVELRPDGAHANRPVTGQQSDRTGTERCGRELERDVSLPETVRRKMIDHAPSKCCERDDRIIQTSITSP
jgi:uncharacterized protein YndB with AHSA1/START domain